MGKIVSITTQKGGVGKTTLAHNLGAGLAQRGYKVLFVDMDGNADLTRAAGAGMPPYGLSMLEVMQDQAKAKDLIQHLPNYDIIGSNGDFTRADIILDGKPLLLKEKLKSLKAQYDFIILDSPPSLSMVTINILAAADFVLIPSEPAESSLNAIMKLYGTISATKKVNKDLRIAGIVITRQKRKTSLSRDTKIAAEQIAKQIGTKVFDTVIREYTSIQEGQTCKEDIYTYKDTVKNAIDDMNGVIDEFLALL